MNLPVDIASDEAKKNELARVKAKKQAKNTKKNG